LLLAGLSEGLGLATFVPLAALATEGAVGSDLPLERLFTGAFEFVGVTPTFGLLLVLIVITFAAKGLLVFLAMLQVSVTVADIAANFRLSIIKALLAARWSYFVAEPAGLIPNTLNVEAQRAADVYSNSMRVFAAILQVLGYILVAALISWQVAVAVIGGGAIMLIVLSPFAKMARKSGNQQTAAFAELSLRVVDNIRGIKSLKVMNGEKSIGPMLEADAGKLRRAMRLAAIAVEATKAAREPLIVLLGATAVGISVTLLEFPLGSAVVMALLFQRSLNRVGTAQNIYQILVLNVPFFQAVRRRLDRGIEAKEPNGTVAAPDFSRSIVLDDVHVSLGGSPVLKGISIEIKAGTITAIVGPSGAGKTTLTDVILGLLQPDRGSVTVDGIPLAGMNMSTWRSQVGYVPQDPFVSHDTVRANVNLGDTDLSDARIKAALVAAGAWEFVAATPLGLDTVLGEQGGRISGGQRQRIAIARALVRDPKLLILDEPSTALDPDTERRLSETLRTLGAGVTLIVVSHQSALVDIAEEVFRISDGRAELAIPGSTQNGLPARSGREGSEQPGTTEPGRHVRRRS
jgi:ATP-binding cassette subfamily C protein